MKPDVAIAGQGVVNLHRTASHRGELVSQFTLGTRVRVLRSRGPWRQVELPDEYRGWALAAALVAAGEHDETMIRGESPRETRVLPFEAWLRSGPRDDAAMVSAVVHGTALRVVERRNGWCAVIMPGSEVAWIPGDALTPVRVTRSKSAGATRIAIARLARGYTGCPYLWGGTTPRGFDCSGLVQRVFGLAGVLMPRDAWMQARVSRPLGDPGEARPGDLFFFGRSRSRITHVAISLGGLTFIHAASDAARGRVAIESLSPASSRHAADLVPFFLGAGCALPPRRTGKKAMTGRRQ